MNYRGTVICQLCGDCVPERDWRRHRVLHLVGRLPMLSAAQAFERGTSRAEQEPTTTEQALDVVRLEVLTLRRDGQAARADALGRAMLVLARVSEHDETRFRSTR